MPPIPHFRGTRNGHSLRSSNDWVIAKCAIKAGGFSSRSSTVFLTFEKSDDLPMAHISEEKHHDSKS